MATGERPPNILLVVFDCARAKSLDRGEGAFPASTPHLARLAREGTSFPRAIAPGNWTVPSHMSLFTGTYPWTHGLRTFARSDRAPPTIASWLSRRGFETAMFTEEVHLVAGYGLEEGYAHRSAQSLGTPDDQRTASLRLFGRSDFVYSRGVRTLIERIPRIAIPLSAINFRQEARFKRTVCGDYLLSDFDEWLSRRDSARPFHAFFNFVDPHEPYPELAARPRWGWSPEGFVQVPRYYLLAVPSLKGQVPWPLVEAAYLRSLAQADAKLGRLLRSLEAAGELGRTFVIVTSDHGQSFGEGGNVYHGCGATESVLRVPLVARPPDGVDRIGVVRSWLSLCEVSSWMKSIALGERPYDEEGSAPVPFPAHPPDRSVVFGEGGPASDPNRSLLGIGADQRWNHRLLAAYRGNTKWIWDLVTGSLWSFAAGPPIDGSPAETLTGEARTGVLRDVYGVQGPRDVERYLGEGGPAPDRPALGDARMRSWGYD